MSYSRWSNSVWYTFWSAHSESKDFQFPTKKLKYSQTFMICDFPSYSITYGELMAKDMYIILQDVKEYYKDKNPTNGELDELGAYITEFIDDVDNHFKWKNFFMYEWYYPLRNKLIK